jgi:3'(2'), 5'-bisphosphate nucleotidase
MSASRGDLLDSLLPIVAEASERILDVYAGDFSVQYKGRRDPVTAADRAANDLICERLTRLHPGVPIVAEESDPSSFEGYQDAPEVFFVDPLDGTREFVARNGDFVVMIGLAVNGRAKLGVIHAPTRVTTWGGIVGEGAFKIRGAGERQQLRSSGPPPLAAATLLVSRSSPEPHLERARGALGIGKVQAVGSAGLKGCYVADGEGDIYLSPGVTGKRWDACAIDALLEAAGARLTDSYGAPLDYSSPELSNRRGLLAAYEPLHRQVLDRLRQLRDAGVV